MRLAAEMLQFFWPINGRRDGAGTTIYPHSLMDFIRHRGLQGEDSRDAERTAYALVRESLLTPQQHNGGFWGQTYFSMYSPQIGGSSTVPTGFSPRGSSLSGLIS